MNFVHLTDLHFGSNKKAERILRKFFDDTVSKLSFDCLIVTGDLGTIAQRQLKTACRNLREAFPDKPIAVIFGNHDYWEKQKGIKHRFRHWPNMLAAQDKILEAYNIHHVNRKGPLIVGDVRISGYDGWYKRLDPPTNDGHWMPEYIGEYPMHQAMSLKAHKDLYQILDMPDDEFKKYKNICLTHFSFEGLGGGHSDYSQNGKHLEFLVNKGFDVICYGHSHMKFVGQLRNTRIYNAGGGVYYDYQKAITCLTPSFIQFPL